MLKGRSAQPDETLVYPGEAQLSRPATTTAAQELECWMRSRGIDRLASGGRECSGAISCRCIKDESWSSVL